MSNEAINWVKTWPGLPTSDKFVLFMIAEHYNEGQHRAWPGVPLLASLTGMDPRSVKRCLKRLEYEHGLIETEPWVNEVTGASMSNRYCLPLYDPLSVREAQLPYLWAGNSSGRSRKAPPTSSVGEDSLFD